MSNELDVKRQPVALRGDEVDTAKKQIDLSQLSPIEVETAKEKLTQLQLETLHLEIEIQRLELKLMTDKLSCVKSVRPYRPRLTQ